MYTSGLDPALQCIVLLVAELKAKRPDPVWALQKANQKADRDQSICSPKPADPHSQTERNMAAGLAPRQVGDLAHSPSHLQSNTAFGATSTALAQFPSGHRNDTRVSPPAVILDAHSSVPSCCAASRCSSWVHLKGKAPVYSQLASRWYHSSRPAVRCKPSVRFASDVELQHQQTNMTRQQDASHPTQPRGPPSTTSHYQRRQLL